MIQKWLRKDRLVECLYIHQLVEQRAEWFFAKSPQISYHPKQWGDLLNCDEADAQEIVVLCFYRERHIDIASWLTANRQTLKNKIVFILEATDDASTVSMCHWGDAIKKIWPGNVVLSQVPYNGEIGWLQDRHIMFAQCWANESVINLDQLRDYTL